MDKTVEQAAPVTQKYKRGRAPKSSTTTSKHFAEQSQAGSEPTTKRTRARRPASQEDENAPTVDDAEGIRLGGAQPDEDVVGGTMASHHDEAGAAPSSGIAATAASRKRKRTRNHNRLPASEIASLHGNDAAPDRQEPAQASTLSPPPAKNSRAKIQVPSPAPDASKKPAASGKKRGTRGRGKKGANTMHGPSASDRDDQMDTDLAKEVADMHEIVACFPKDEIGSLIASEDALPPAQAGSSMGGQPFLDGERQTLSAIHQDEQMTVELELREEEHIEQNAASYKHESTPEATPKAEYSPVSSSAQRRSVRVRKEIQSPYFTPPRTPAKQDERGSEKRSVRSKAAAEVPRKRPRGGIVSAVPFPPLASPTFGLVQERLCHDPFRLLIAVTFLNRTHGKHAIPIFYKLMEAYPTMAALADAKKPDVVEIIHRLGFQNQRAEKYIRYAQTWRAQPPQMGKRFPVRDYPVKGVSARDIKKDEVLSDTDPRDAWEIGHITSGKYAIDSWRIFCRDALRGLATSFNGEGAREEGFQPEWMRVLPEDKELRAFLRWMWLKEGIAWDPLTGEKEFADEDLLKAAIEGRIAWDDAGGMQILDGLSDPDTGLVAVWTQDGGLEYLSPEMQIPWRL